MDPPRWLLYGLNHPFWPVNDFKVQAWKMKILLCHLFQAVVLSHLEVGPKTVGVYRCMGVCVCLFVCLCLTWTMNNLQQIASITTDASIKGQKPKSHRME